MLRAMSANAKWFVSFGLVSALSVSGCGAHGNVRQVIRQQFAAELNCREVQVLKRDVWYSYDSPHQYKVSGCGVLRTYACPVMESDTVSYDKPACTWVEGDADKPKSAQPSAPDGAMDDADAMDSADPMKDADALDGTSATEPKAAPVAKAKPSKAAPTASPTKAKAGVKFGSSGVKFGGTVKAAGDVKAAGAGKK